MVLFSGIKAGKANMFEDPEEDDGALEDNIGKTERAQGFSNMISDKEEEESD